MRNPSIRRLQALRDAALREAMQAALDRPDDDLRGKIERIEAYDRLLAAAPKRRWRELGWAMAVAVICVSLLGAGLSIRVPATRIVLEVTAGTSTLALVEPWQFNDSAAVQTPSLFLRELEEVELPAAVEVSQPLQKNAWASFEGGRVAVSELSVGAGSILTFEAGPARHVDLYVSGGSLAGTVTLTGSQRVTAGQGDSDRSIDVEADFPIPEIVSFRSGSQGVVPAHLRIAPIAPIELYDLRVRALSFTRDVPSEPGGVEFVSTIDEGRLTLSDIGRTVELPEYELLSLRDVAGRIRRMAVDQRIELVFEGKAAQALVGPHGFQQDLTPTIAEYLYHNQRVVFLWSTLAFAWGVLWSARRMLVF
jgi:hypothetical protein